MRIIAFITDAPTVRDILVRLGAPTTPPRIAPARGPPLWEATGAPRENNPYGEAQPRHLSLGPVASTRDNLIR
jgi:hypothetical protein